MDNIEDFKILVVDDSPELMDLTVRSLKKERYKVFTASTSTECMQVLHDSRPHIILLDEMLSDTNGLDLIRKIKNDPQFSTVFIILLSEVKIHPDHISEGLEKGADGYIIRPVGSRELLARVKAACRIISAEKKIRSDHILLQACLDSPEDIIIHAIDKQYNYLTFNAFHQKAMLQSYGVKVKSGMHILECITNKEDIIRAKANYDRALVGESHNTIEEYGELNRQYYETRYNPIYNEQKEIIGVTVFANSVSEKKLMEESLRKSEEKFRKAFITSPDSININRLNDGMYISINEGFTKITGYTEKETVGKTSIELNIWADLSDRDKLVKGIKANGKVENLETTFKMKDGSLRKGIMSAALIDLDGVPHILSMTRDVTERKQAEMALLKSKEQYDSLISNIPVGVYILHSSPEGAFALDYVSPRMAEMINLSVYALLSDARNIFQAIHPDDRDGFIKLNREGIQHQRPFDWKGRVIHNGMIRWLHVRSTPELQEDGDTLWHGIIVDITERKQAEEELKERSRDLQNELENKTKAEKELQRSLNQLDISRLATLNLLENIKIEMEQRKKVEEEVKRLNAGLEIRVLERTSQFEETNKELEAFAYSVSHDLRAPLRAIDGFSKFVLEDYGRKLDKEGQRLLGLIRSNTQKMDQLITDILTLSRVTRSEHKVSKVDMTKMALSMLNEAVSPEIQEKLSLKIDELPEAFADSTYMKQVWINLISNAVKFSSLKKKQMITIGGFNREGFHVYYVKDNGVGFNPEYAHKLFGVFQRLHKSEDFEGTGVGLAIVQRIIHRHGGKVWAEGKEGKGATFYFSLPAKSGGQAEDLLKPDIYNLIK
jgi:PAS domain S-box-containing protein